MERDSSQNTEPRHQKYSSQQVQIYVKEVTKHWNSAKLVFSLWEQNRDLCRAVFNQLSDSEMKNVIYSLSVDQYSKFEWSFNKIYQIVKIGRCLNEFEALRKQIKKLRQKQSGKKLKDQKQKKVLNINTSPIQSHDKNQIKKNADSSSQIQEGESKQNHPVSPQIQNSQHHHNEFAIEQFHPQNDHETIHDSDEESSISSSQDESDNQIQYKLNNSLETMNSKKDN